MRRPHRLDRRLPLLPLLLAAACGGHPGAPLDAAGGGDGAAPDAAVPTDGAAPDASLVPECFAGAAEQDLPERVIFRSGRTSFNRRWYVAVHEGRIWVKPNPEGGQAPGEWALLGTGLPAGSDVHRFDPPTEIVEVSADHTWLHALSSAGVFYRGTDATGDVHASFTWSDAWGHPAATGPGITLEFPNTHGWSVSDSQGTGVHHYEDRLGTTHGVGMGVAHAYRLLDTGRALIFNDWWLPADWSRQICLPDRGTLLAEHLSVSASTIFVVGARGELYTRLYDFDTSGENDTLTYSFLITAAAGDTRALPAEGWRRQPDVDGLITRRVTIFQDGQGNAARELRVEGVQAGRTGFFHKRIFDDAWAFEETGLEVCGPFLNAPGRPAPDPVDPADRLLRGTLVRQPTLGTPVAVDLEVANFNLMCSPADARLLVDGSPVTVGGVPVTFPLHHVHALILETRAREYWLDGVAAKVRAALLLPPGLDAIDDPDARSTVASLFEDRFVVNLQGTALPDALALTEMTWLDPAVGVVPGDEKADPGNTLTLQATAP